MTPSVRSHDVSARVEEVGAPDRVQTLCYGVIVLVGSVLIVLTSLNQPYNQNEWKQIAPYGAPDLGVAVNGTRQPPLGPLLGTLVQRLIGEGHLEQRVVPMASGIGCLLLMMVLLRGLRTDYAGVAALAFMATAPVFLRFSAYTRPYALPTMLMLACALAGTRWLETGRRRWLVLAFGCALALPLTRVPEPTVFLAASAVLLAVAGLRSSLPRRRAWPLAGGLLGSLVTVGAFTSLALVRETRTTSTGDVILDLNPFHALARLPAGLQELWEHVLPLYGRWFPWWPLVVLIVILAAVVPTARRRLLGIWWWLPFVLAPLAFLVAYHSVNAYPLEMRHYQIRFACFWVPPLVMAVAAVLESLARDTRLRRPVVPLLALALVVGQLPGTWRVLTENDAVDFAQAGVVLRDRVPEDAVVIYDSASRAGWWRQPFSGAPRYLRDTARVVSATRIAHGQVRLPRSAPVHVLLLDSDCAGGTACDIPGLAWDGVVGGYEQEARFDRFTLYTPTDGQRGADGAVRALLSLVDAFGEEWAVTDAAAAARLLEARGRPGRAAALLRRVCDGPTRSAADACRAEVVDFGLERLLQSAAR